MKKRLFVGNLGTAVKGKHLKEKFSEFGDVENVELHTKNDESGRPFKKFAYLDMNISQEQLVDCIKDLNNLNWNGSDIIVQVAKESYIQRIQREAQGGAPVPAAPPSRGSEERSSAARPGKEQQQQPWARQGPPGQADRGREPPWAPPAEDAAPPSSEEAAHRRQLANARRLASLKQRAAEGQAQRRLLREDLAALDRQGAQRKRRTVFTDSEEEEEEREEERRGAARALFDEDDDPDGGGAGEEDFRLRPHFQGHLGHQALELQSRFAGDDRFRLSERFLESEEEGGDDQADGEVCAGAGGELWDSTQERSRNLDILWDVLGPAGAAAARGTHHRPLFKDASQLRFDPTKEDAARFELKPAGKPEKKAPQPEEPPPPQVSSEQFYEVSSRLHEALAPGRPAAAAFSLAQMFAGQLEHDDREGGSSSSSEEAAGPGGREAPLRRKTRSPPPAFLRRDDSSGDEQEQPAAEHHSGPVGDMFRRMDDDRFATVVDRPLFFFVPGDRRLLEGAKFFRCQSDPDTIRRNFFDGRVALVKLLLSKRKMAKRALERRLGGKAGSRQWRLGKLRHGKQGGARL